MSPKLDELYLSYKASKLRIRSIFTNDSLNFESSGIALKIFWVFLNENMAVA